MLYFLLHSMRKPLLRHHGCDTMWMYLVTAEVILECLSPHLVLQKKVKVQQHTLVLLYPASYLLT